MKRIALTLDLKDDPTLIRQYEAHHKAVWPEVQKNILESGIKSMRIYRLDTRLFMYIEASDAFDLEEMAKQNTNNPIVQEWENLMWKFQKPLTNTQKDVKWVVMKKIYELGKKGHF